MSAAQRKISNRVQAISGKFTMCRTWMHAWDYTSVQRDGRDYLQGMICMRCQTTKTVRVDGRTGERRGNAYVYPEGYQLDGGGPLTAKERGELRLFEVTGHSG